MTPFQTRITRNKFHKETLLEKKHGYSYNCLICISMDVKLVCSVSKVFKHWFAELNHGSAFHWSNGYITWILNSWPQCGCSLWLVTACFQFQLEGFLSYTWCLWVVESRGTREFLRMHCPQQQGGWCWHLQEHWKQRWGEEHIIVEGEGLSSSDALAGMVGIHKWLQHAMVCLWEYSYLWPSLKPVSHKEKHGEWKKQKEKGYQGSYKQWNVFATEVTNVAVKKPYWN